MTKSANVISLLTFTAGAVFCLTSAENVACFNANGEIKRIFCDGRDITHQFDNLMNPNECNCIKLGVCGNITMRVKHRNSKHKGQSQAGIGVCQTTNPTPYRNWVCRKSPFYKRWKLRLPAQETTQSKQCHGFDKLQCEAKMFWNARVRATLVDCVLQQCADLCDSCAVVGPGQCDPGRCTYGNADDGRCNRKCRVDWLAWGLRNSSTATGNGHITLTDVKSNSQEVITANQPGYYLAVIDMDQCTFIYKNYTNWLSAPGFFALGQPAGSTSQLTQWFQDTSMKNVLAVDLSVGGLSYTKVGFVNASYAPSGSAWRLGESMRTAYIDYNHNCSYSAVFTGLQGKPVTMDSFVINVPDSNYDAVNPTC